MFIKILNTLKDNWLALSTVKRAASTFVVGSVLILAIWTLSAPSSIQTPLVSAESLSSTIGTNLQTDKNSATDKVPQAINANTYASGSAKKCVPVSNNMPSPLSLTDLPPVLKKQIDAPNRYRIFGNDSTTIRSQIRACGPVTADTDEAAFAAVTRYQLTWQYQYANDGGICKINKASVGIHVSQTLPVWQPTDSTQMSLTTKWSAFDAALATHEDGHAVIDVQYAQTLLQDLNQFPPTSCDLLAQSVKQLTDSTVSELEQANDIYDFETDHGATQGAILP